MDKQYLNDEFNRFFEFPTEDKSHVSSVSAKLFVEHIAYPLEREIEQLRQRVAELEYQLNTEIGSYASKQIAKLTAERDSAYKLADHYRAERDKATQYWQIAEGRCDALKQQRDELVAALEQFATWGRMQHKAQSKGCHATFDMMSLKDEIDLAEAAIASVKEKQNAAD